MRKASETREVPPGPMRATFEVPRDLVEEFRLIAKRRDQTLSQELRRLMREYVEREAA